MHPPLFKVGDGVYNHPPPPGLVTKIYLLEIETENEISTFLALIICKASSFKIVWSNNFYIKYVITFLVSTKYMCSPIRPLQMNFNYE